MTIGHTLTLSIGGSPEAAALWSVGSTPASAASVPYLADHKGEIHSQISKSEKTMAKFFAI